MLPFVVGGGILIAICFIFGIKSFDPADPSYNSFSKLLISASASFKVVAMAVCSALVGGRGI